MPKLFQQCVTAYFITIPTFKITLISDKPFIRMNYFNPCSLIIVQYLSLNIILLIFFPVFFCAQYPSKWK